MKIKQNINLSIFLILLFTLSYSVFAVQDWGQISYMFPATPFAQNGPGLMGKGCTEPFDTHYRSEAVVCAVNSSWDLGSVSMFLNQNTVYWKVTAASNFTQAKFCGGTKNVSLIIGFNSDGLTGTGNFRSGKPNGLDYIFYFNGSEASVKNTTAYFFRFNGTLANQNDSNFIMNNTAIVEINISDCNGSSSYSGQQGGTRPSTIYFAVNKSYFDRPLNFNQTTYVSSTNNQVFAQSDSVNMSGLDTLGITQSGGQNQDFSGVNKSTFSPEFKFGCGQYAKSNATICENNTNGDQCTWDSSFNDCFPKSFFGGGSGFSCSDSCGECTTQGTCAGNTKCTWDTYMYNFKTHEPGSCKEDSSKYVFMPGKNCDASCGDCSTEYICNNSKYPDPTGQGGKGCKWLNDSFGNKWCSLSTFNSVSLTCNPLNLDKCYSQAECQTKGGSWDNTYYFCKSSTANTETCFDGSDNDNDTMVDCADLDCKTNKFCGGDLDVLTGGFNTTDQFGCMNQKYMKDFNPEVKLDFLGSDPLDAGLVNNNTHLDINGLSVGEAGDALVLGIGVKNVTPLAICGVGAGHANKSATYIYMLDTDKNFTTGCGLNVSNSNKTGFEYRIEIFLNYTGTNYTQTKKGFICVKTTGQMALNPIRMPDPLEDGKAPNKIAGCRYDTVSTGVVYEDIGDPANMRISAASFDTTTNLSYPNDTILDIYYGQGQNDFKPIDCFSNPTACGSAFSSTGKGKFMPFQDCFSDLDTDGNGIAGCADAVCSSFPKCQNAANKYNASADTDPPTVISTTSYPFKSSVDIKVITDEPTNLSLILYNQSSICADSAKNATLVESIMFVGDTFRPFHGMFISNTTPKAAGILQSGQTQFYKTRTCDQNGNCASSSCLNYSLKATTDSENVSFKFEYTAPNGNSMLGNLSIKFKNGTTDISITNGSVKNIAQYLQNATLVIENQNQSGSPYTIELVGIDLTKTINTNLTSGINATNFSSNGTFIGFDSATWYELAQNLGIDSIKLNISIPNSTANTSYIYNNLFKCASDNITSCTNVTANCTKLGGGNTSVDWVLWEVPTSLGFSVYGYSAAGNTGTSSSGSSGSSSGGGGSSSSTTTPAVVPAVTTTVQTPTPATTTASKSSDSPVTAAATEEPTETGDTTELTDVENDGSTTKKVVKTSDAKTKDLVQKTFSQMFGSAGSGMGALIVIVLIIVIVVGIVYYRKTHKY